MTRRQAPPRRRQQRQAGGWGWARLAAAGLAVALLAGMPSPRPALAADPAPKPAKSKYRKSKLTNDESEIRADHRRLLLTTGEDKAVDLDFEANGGTNGISIGNPTSVATTLVKIGDKRQIVFKPLKAGETTVTVRDADGTIRLIFQVHVAGSNLLRVAGEVRNLLRDVEGLDIRIVGLKVVIDGEVLVPADYGRLLTVIQDKAYSEYVMNLATLSPVALSVLAKRIQEDVNTFAPNVKTRVVNGMIFLEGQVDSGDIANRVKQVASLYVPALMPGSMLEKDPAVQRLPPRPLIQTFLVVNPPPPKKTEKLVRITVHFVELSKSYSKIFGFKWQPGFTADPQISVGQNAQGGAGASGASFSATISSLLPKLKSLQTAGYARIIKSGTVIVRSGQNASFSEATQFPFSIPGNGAGAAPTPATSNVGLEVAVTPQILGQSEDISMELKMDQTNLVGRDPASGTVPVTATHKVETKIYVKSGESAAVAGVMSADVGTDFNIDDPSPGSFDQGTDPLFTLIHSKGYRKKKSQFVIFVTPQIIENASEGTEDLKRNFRVKAK